MVLFEEKLEYYMLYQNIKLNFVILEDKFRFNKNKCDCLFI